MFALKWLVTNKITGSTIGVIGLAIVCLRKPKPSNDFYNSSR